MKHKILKKLIASSLVSLALVTLVPVGASAAWISGSDGAWYYSMGYSFATGWKYINGSWYYFDSMGKMQTGWIPYGDNWYYTDLSGAMQTGLIQIEGKIHLFSSSGEMQKGSSMINGQLCNFDDNGVYIGSYAITPIKAFDYYGNSTMPYASNQLITSNSTMSKDIPSDGLYHPKQYTIKFKDPDADNEDDELLKTKTVDENSQMYLYIPTKSGYTFVEWNTKSNGNGTGYLDSDRIYVTKDMTLYAQWEENTNSDNNNNGNNTDTVKVTSIAVSGASGLKSIAVGGSLQMTCIVSPGDATTQSVKWSILSEGGSATISTTGKLTGTGAGKVIVKAAATDGSGVVGTTEITIAAS